MPVNTKKVGKVTVAEDAKNEVEISARLRKVPLASNYFLLDDPEVCELAPMSEQREKDLAQCVALSRPNEHRISYKNAREIFAPFGGVTSFYTVLTQYDFNPKYFDFFAFLQHILEAGATMAIAGVSHFDLHPNNFLVDDKGVVRILDFGFSFLADKLTKEIVNEHWRVLFFGAEKDGPHPSVTNMEAPEVTVFNGIRNKLSPEKSIEAVVSFKQIFKDIHSYLGLTKLACIAELTNFWNTSEATQSMDELKLFQRYWPGFDAWSIGCILMYIFKKVIILPEFTQGPWIEKQVAVYAVFHGLLDPNPKTRLDCVEALAVFDPKNDWIQRFGQKWLAARAAQRANALKQI